MEEVIGVIVVLGVQPAIAMANRLYLDIIQEVKNKRLEKEITDIKLKNKTTIEFIVDDKKYIYIFRSINQTALDGMIISGFTISSIVLKEGPIKEIETIMKHLRSQSMPSKYDPFTPLDILLPGFIR